MENAGWFQQLEIEFKLNESKLLINNDLKLQSVTGPVVDPVMDIVEVVDGEPQEKQSGQDGDDDHQDAEFLNNRQEPDWFRRWPHQHLKEQFFLQKVSI